MSMKEASVYHCPRGVDFTEEQWKMVPRAEISHFPWDNPANSYRPEAWGQAIWDDIGLTVRLYCREENPRTTYSQPDEPVYKDSCLEFFVMAADGEGYYNFELNSKAVLLAGQGKPGSRSRIPPEKHSVFQPKPLSLENGWGVEIRVPFQALGIGERKNWQELPRLRCNFYKCGDDTDLPHYGCWSLIDNPTPQFHLPAFFGCLKLTEA